jgi:hypothetical protein
VIILFVKRQGFSGKATVCPFLRDVDRTKIISVPFIYGMEYSPSVLGKISSSYSGNISSLAALAAVNALNSKVSFEALFITNTS